MIPTCPYCGRLLPVTIALSHPDECNERPGLPQPPTCRGCGHAPHGLSCTQEALPGFLDAERCLCTVVTA